MGSGTLPIILILALLILVSVIWLWRRSQSREYLPPTSDSPLREVDDTRIYISRVGSGPTLVLLHGLGASTFTWRLVAPELSRSFDLISLDLPGFGRSDKNPKLDYSLDAQSRRVLALLDQLNVNQAHLMGSSMGGALALWLARLQPRRFPKVMALAPATNPKRVWLSWRWLQWAFPVAPKFYNRRLLTRLYSRVVTNADLVTEEALEGYHQPYSDPQAVLTLLKATELLGDLRLPAELAHVRSEVCLVYGSSDLVVHQHDVERLQEILPHSTLHIRPGGHHLQEDDPAWVVAKAREFFL